MNKLSQSQEGKYPKVIDETTLKMSESGRELHVNDTD